MHLQKIAVELEYGDVYCPFSLQDPEHVFLLFLMRPNIVF